MNDDEIFEKSGDGWSGSIGGWCPVQGFGLVDGHTWYFRARGSHWEMGIAGESGDGPEFEDKAVGATLGDTGWFTQEPWGKWPDAGYMPTKTAWGFIEQSIVKWRKDRVDNAN